MDRESDGAADSNINPNGALGEGVPQCYLAHSTNPRDPGSADPAQFPRTLVL